LEDVQTLNQWADEGKLDVSKLSFPAFFNHLDKYTCLTAGAALGKGVGPLLIAKLWSMYPILNIAELLFREKIQQPIFCSAMPFQWPQTGLLWYFRYRKCGVEWRCGYGCDHS
jgi:hypothetical protein